MMPDYSYSVMIPFLKLREELLLHIASYLQPFDLLRYQCTSKELSKLNTEPIWEKLCEKRWEKWPRYRLTEEKRNDIIMEQQNNNNNNNNNNDNDNTGGLLSNTSSWKERYFIIEEDATRLELRSDDLRNLKWYLCFVLSGIRGEGLSGDHMSVEFTITGDYLLVPGYPPLPTQLINREPPTTCNHIRQNLRGDQPFSKTQYLSISNFPPHFITRKSSDAEWLIVNENVMMVSRGVI
jgi:hypothetical protein